MNVTTIVAIFSEDFNSHVLGRICPCQVVTNTEGRQEDLQPPTINKQSPVNSSISKALTIKKCHEQFSHSNKTGKECIVCLQSRAAVRFIYEVMPMIQDVSVDKEVLKIKYKFSEEDIRTLMNIGLLVVRSVGSYWLSFPNAGEFMKHFLKGRAALLRLIKKCKFSEILQSELEKRQLDKAAKFGIQYHIHDLIGGDFVDCVESTSGTLLRFTAANEK
ncbi:inactive serine/threonine-protein kinase 19-like [Hetaerina americana]|uniref:inactive serine/threonine-protein kinase 19-like n=1 Tax=Hetaerina americana TaxID=62018 RepID=UPI003A7F2001